MKIEKVIHPEILKGLRGSKQDIEMCRLVMSILKPVQDTLYAYLVDVGPGSTFQEKQCAMLLAQDKVAAHFFTGCKKFLEKKGDVFCLGKNLADCLLKIDKKIPINYIPDNFSAYIVFPENTVFDEEGAVPGAYAFIDINKEGQRWLKITYSMPSKSISHFSTPLRETTVNEMFKEMKEEGLCIDKHFHDNMDKRKNVFRVVLNTLLYINSADPDIQKLRPFHKLSKGQQKIDKRKYGVENLCTLPVQLISWGFHTELRNKKEDEWSVSGHFRWQPCGEKFSQVKLIWIDEYTKQWGESSNTKGDLEC